ncbi:breast cancer type 1 susceptibility protein homolog [Haliotis asinina]|uniref:breast cancer type 1 susceptibility protein homolog n=1 Tax=Haliotis asinina TaxID=109174 RepID=UPI003531B42D
MMTSNQVQKVLGSMSKSLECAICLDLLKNPIATRCHHHFCRFCITEFLKTKTSVPCPLCKEPVTRRSLQEQERLSNIVEHVRDLITAYQDDTGEFFSPSRHVQGTEFFPCTPEPIFPRETTGRKRQIRKNVKQATKCVDSPGDGALARSHEADEETATSLETRLHKPVSQPRNTNCTAVRKMRRCRQGNIPLHVEEEGMTDGTRQESDKRQVSVSEQEAALLKYIAEGSYGQDTNVDVAGYSVGTDMSTQFFSGVHGAGDTLRESSTGQREARAREVRKGDNSCDGTIGTDVDESFNRETKSVDSAKTLVNRDIAERKEDTSCIETKDIDVNESFKTETKSIGSNISVGKSDLSPVCEGSTKTSNECISRMECGLQLTPESEYEGEGCGSEISGDGGLLFQSQEVKKKTKPAKLKLSIYTRQAAGGTRRGKNKDSTLYETDFQDGSPVSSLDVPNLTKDFHSAGPMKTYSKASVRQHHKSSMVKQWIEEAQHTTDKGCFSQTDCLASNRGNTMLTNTGDPEPTRTNLHSEFENFGFGVTERDSVSESRPSASKQFGEIQEVRQSTQAPAANRKRMFKTKATKEQEVVSTGQKTTESQLPSSDPYEFKSSQTTQPTQKIKKKRGRKGNKGRLADVLSTETSVSEVGGGVDLEQAEVNRTSKKDRKAKHVHFDVKSPEQEMSSLIEKIVDAEDHDFAFCTQDAVSNMAGQEGDGAQLEEGFDDVINEDIEMIDDSDKDGVRCGKRQTDSITSLTTNSNLSNLENEKSQMTSIVPPTPMLSLTTDKSVTRALPSPVNNLVQISKVTADHRKDEAHLPDSDSRSQMPLPIPRKKPTSPGMKTENRALNLDLLDVPLQLENSGQSHISPTPSVELVKKQDENMARQDEDVTQDDQPSSGNSSSTEDLNISLDNTQFEEADLDIQPDEIKKQLSQMSNNNLSSAEGNTGHLDRGSSVNDADVDKAPHQDGPSFFSSKQINAEDRQSVNQNHEPLQCGMSVVSESQAGDGQTVASDNLGCSPDDQGAEDKLVAIVLDSVSTICNVPQNSQSVTGAEKLGGPNSGSVITKDGDSFKDNIMAADIEGAVQNGKSQSGDVIPESIEEESVNLIEDTVETSSERSTRSLRTRAGRHQADSKSRPSRRSSSRKNDPVIEVACSDVEEPVAFGEGDSQKETQKSKEELQSVSLVHSQASTLPTSVTLGSDEQTLPPDVGVSDDEEAAGVVETDDGATEASVDVPETVTESLSLLEQHDEQDVASSRSEDASTLESVSILKTSDTDVKKFSAGSKKNQQKGSVGQGKQQDMQAAGKRNKSQKRKRIESRKETSVLPELLDIAETPSIPEVSSAPITITLDDSDDEPLVIHRPKRKCFSLDGSPLQTRAKESRVKLSRRAKPSAKKSLDVKGSCENVDYKPMDTGMCSATEGNRDCEGHGFDTNSVRDTISKESNFVAKQQDPQCVNDSPQLMNTLSDSSQVQESMTDIFNRNTEQSLTADNASQDTLAQNCDDSDVEVDRSSPCPKQTVVKKSHSSNSDSSDSDASKTPRSMKKGVKAARGLASLKKKQSREDNADSPIVISSSKYSSGKVAEFGDEDIRVKSQLSKVQARCPNTKQQLSLTDSECVGPTPTDVPRTEQESRNEAQMNDSVVMNKHVLSSDTEDGASVDSSDYKFSRRYNRERNKLKQTRKGDCASGFTVAQVQSSTDCKTKSKRRTKHVLSSDDEDAATTVESSSYEHSGRSREERTGRKQRHRGKMNLSTVQSSAEGEADDDVVVLDDFEEPTARTEGSSSDEEFVLRDDDEVIRKADMPEEDAMFADLPQTSSPVHASSPVQAPGDESDEAPIGVRKTSRRAVITDSDSNDDDDDESCLSDQQMNFTSSSAFSSQSDVLTTQQQGKLEKDLENMREEIKRLEAMKDVVEREDKDVTMVEVAKEAEVDDVADGNCKMATPGVIPASNKTKDGDNSSDDDDLSDHDLFLSPRSPSPPPDFDTLPKPRKSAEIVKAFEIIEKFKSPTQSKYSTSRTVLSPLQTSNMGNPRSKKIVLITSGLSREQAMSVHEFTKVTGCVFFPKFNKTVTHVVVKKAAGEDRPICDRTLKYFQGIVGKCWVVTFDWVRDSLLAKKPLPEEKYEIVGDTVIVEDHHGPRRSRTSHKKLFSGFTLTCIGVSDEMTKDDMSLLLQQGGATLADDPWELGKMAAAIPMIIRCLDTEEEAPTKSEVEHFNCFYKHNRLITVSREWVLDSISTWRLQPLDDYILNTIKNIVLPF